VSIGATPLPLSDTDRARPGCMASAVPLLSPSFSLDTLRLSLRSRLRNQVMPLAEILGSCLASFDSAASIATLNWPSGPV
jgi:hypothetical protein